MSADSGDDKPVWQGMKRTSLDDLQSDKAPHLRRTHEIMWAYLGGLRAINLSISRNPTYRGNHLLRYLSQELIEGAIAIEILAIEGVQAVVKRELRFVLEASAKLASVEQSGYDKTVEEKLNEYRDRLQSHRISVQREVDLNLLPVALQHEFIREVGWLYGTTSSFVHWTVDQIERRIKSVEAGRVAGQETVDDIMELNALLERALAASLTLVFHSVPKSAIGDWILDGDGNTIDWYFTQSKFIAAVDAEFDYKHERQSHLDAIKATRAARIRF
ncbi:MAG: hypothetical protein KKF33_13750 [Alphaproteobacteria bacterium]|nr:hypothetical protein [Alphaproteobacteria bacterium]